MTTIVSTTLDQLDTRVRGSVHRPGTDGYDRLASPWNLTIPTTPLAVLEALDAQDVVAAVRWAAENDQRVDVRCTGHGAVRDDADVLLIHTGGLDELTIDADGIARIGAGLTWAAVIDAAAPRGLCAVSGSSPHVGVVGLLTGGGIGPLARSLGVSSDRVRAFDVVTGDGELRRATATENPALFWGLRGGKGALGIVTAVELELVAIPMIVGGAVFFGPEDIAGALGSWSEWSAGLPPEATTSFAIFRLPPMPGIPEILAGRATCAVRFTWTGDREEGLRIAEAVPRFGSVLIGGIGEVPSAAIGAIHADPVDPMPSQECSALLGSLPRDAVDALLEVAGADAECPQIMVELRQLGGAIAREPLVGDAFDHRDAAFVMLAIGIGAGPGAAPTAANARVITDALVPWTVDGLLPNFGASDDAATAQRVYTAGTLARLGSLADAYDPRSVIRAADPIRTAAGSVR